MNILVLGIGQSMRRDDAAGLEAIRQWQSRYPLSAGRVNVAISEQPGFEILDSLKGMDVLIIVDAIKSLGAAGEVIRFGPEDVVTFTKKTKASHGWGIAETLRMGQSLDPSLSSCRIALIGITGKDFSMGEGLSPELSAAVGQAADMVEREIQESFTEINKEAFNLRF